MRLILALFLVFGLLAGCCAANSAADSGQQAKVIVYGKW